MANPTMKKNENEGEGRCHCVGSEATRREFLAKTSCLAFAAMFVGMGAGSAISGSAAGAECSYQVPATEGVSIDSENQVILVRSHNHIYAFALACPHENTALRWRPQDGRFQCPRHQSKYQPDGTFISGRATRNMDRFAIRLEGSKVIVNLDKLYRSNEQKSEWESAFIAL